MSSLFKSSNIFGGTSGLGDGGAGDVFGDDLGGLGGSGGGAPSTSSHNHVAKAEPVSVFSLSRSGRNKDHILVQDDKAAASGATFVSVVYSKSKPNVVAFLGAEQDSRQVIGDGNFSKLKTTSTLSLRGVPIEFKGDMSGNYVFNVGSIGSFTWKLDEMSGSLSELCDGKGMLLARFRPEGMLSDVKTIEILVQADSFILEFILFSAVATRMYEKATVKQMKKAMDIVSAVTGGG